MTLRSSMVALAFTVAGCSSAGETVSGAPAPSGGGAPGGSAATSDPLAEDLRYLREEEKVARDTYVTLYGTWTLQPHKNIAASEQTHMDRVRETLAQLGIADPVEDDAVGAFTNASLGALHRDLVAQGSASEIASLVVGATIEDLDIRDLAAMMERTDDARALATYRDLACGSRNHLRAFVGQLASRGTSYAPQYVARADFDAIVGGANERCGP